MIQTELLGDESSPPKSHLHQEAQVTGDQAKQPVELQSATSAAVFAAASRASESIAESTVFGASCFFPCNREDALLLLGSLCVSEYFPDTSVQLAIQPEGVALLEDGLRGEEIDLLLAGKVERFPLLVEVKADVAIARPRIIGFKDVLGLVFRNQDEADDFRFRPVDEFDTEIFSTRVDAALFHFGGDPRFVIRHELSDGARAIGTNSDRLTAGVLRLLSLGNSTPSCRSTICRFLSRPVDDVLNGEEIDFSSAAEILTGANPFSVRTRHQYAVVSAFASMEPVSAGSLVDEVMRNLSVFPDIDSGSAKLETKWAEVARDVVKSRIALTGDLISDERSVLLRAALLGLVADRPSALSAFLNAEKPSGPRVTTAAAFLVGLKYGLLNLSWSEKKLYAAEISAVAKCLISESVSSGGNAGQIFSVQRQEDEASSTLTIGLRGITLAMWTEKKVVLPDAVTQWWLGEFDKLHYPVMGLGRSVYSWVVRFSPARLIEVTHCGIGEPKFAMMRYFFDEREKLRKSKDLKANFSKGAMFWYPGTDDAGQTYLSCDVALLPDNLTREFLLTKLEEAICASLVPKRVAKKGKI